MRLANRRHGEFRQNDQGLTTHSWLSSEYVGTGPFKLKEFVPGSYMDLVAFDKYSPGRPKIDQITVKFIPDSAYAPGVAGL